MSKFTDTQECPVCNVRIKDHTMLRCAPADDLELARIERARLTGKAPKPTWYKVSTLPFGANLDPDLRQAYPAHVRSIFTRQSDPWFDRSGGSLPSTDNVAEYVREFERMKNLKGASHG